MSNRKKKYYLLIFWTLTLIFPAFTRLFAQGWEDQGEIENAQVVIEKSRDIVLPQAPRNFEKVPPLPVEEMKTPELKYDFTDVNTRLPLIPVQPRVLKLKDEPLEKLYKGYVRGGFGNYTSPFLDGYLYNKREKNYLFGAHVFHRSSAQGPVDKGNSGNGISGFEISGNHFQGPLTLGADAGYDHTYLHFYGYPEGAEVDRDTIRQHFNRFHINGSVQSTPENNKPGFLLNAGYSNLADIFKTNESQIRGKFKLSIPVKEDLSFGLLADALLITRKDSLTINRNLIKFQPYVKYQYQDLDIRGSINTVIQNDTISGRGPVLLYPIIDLAYHINDSFTGFLKLDGDMQEVTYNSITAENPYVHENVPLYHTDKKFELDWGLKANLGNIAFFKAGFSYSSLRDMYYYLNDSLNLARFNMVYDRGITNLTNIYGELNLSKPGLYMVNLKAAYYKYNVDQIEVPWHRPAWTVDFISRYDIYNKIILSADLYFRGGIKAKDFTTGNVITLSTVNDINFTIDYLFSTRFSLFLDFRNILGNNYELYWRYPSRGIQFMAGASFNF